MFAATYRAATVRERSSLEQHPNEIAVCIFRAIRVRGQESVGTSQRGNVARSVPLDGSDFAAVNTQPRGKKSREPRAVAEVTGQPRERHVQRGLRLSGK